MPIFTIMNAAAYLQIEPLVEDKIGEKNNTK